MKGMRNKSRILPLFLKRRYQQQEHHDHSEEIAVRHYSKDPPGACMKGSAAGLLVGIFSKNDGRHDTAIFTKEAEKYNKRICGNLNKVLRLAGPCPKLGEVRIFYGLEPEFAAVGVVGLGDRCDSYDDVEMIDRSKENSRVAAGSGARTMDRIGLSKLYIESFTNLEAAAEGAALGLWRYQAKKNKNYIKVPVLEPYGECELRLWEIGMLKSAAQNLTRELSETPANVLTPVKFAHKTVEVLSGTGVCVEVRQRDWAERQGMGAFLAVAKGSCEQPIFLELWYCGTGDDKCAPLALVGMGCTFNAGGLQLKEKDNMLYRWGDMSAAAIIVATFKAVAALKLPINLRGLIPLCENMPGAGAMRPGDIVQARNEKSILIQDTNCAGRLMMADALAYSFCYCPTHVIDIGTMSVGVHNGLSTAATGVFCNSEQLWENMQLASIHTGDRVWRLPLFEHYGLKMTLSTSVDTKNYGRYGWGGEPCRAAAFLREFVPRRGEGGSVEGWMHLDTWGTNVSDGLTDPVYLRQGLTGRPIRTLIEFLGQFCLKAQPKVINTN